MLPAHYYGSLLSEPHIAPATFFVFFIWINWSLVWKMLMANDARKNWILAYLLQFCSFHFLDRYTAMSESLVRGEEKRFSFCLLQHKRWQNPRWTEPWGGINYTRSQTWNVILSLYKRLPCNSKTNLKTDWIRKLAQFIFFHLDSQ